MLDYEDRTTITVVRTDTKAAAEGLNINISDKSGNAATGQTDAGGQLIVPNNQSSTGNENGTIGGASYFRISDFKKLNIDTL